MLAASSGTVVFSWPYNVFGVLNVGTTEEETLRPTTLTGKIVQPPENPRQLVLSIR